MYICLLNKSIQLSRVFSYPLVSLTDVTAQITPSSVTSPVSTTAKVSQAATKTTLSEPDVAFPAVLKGSTKQRVPPPVPPRGSPKTKRGGANSGGLDTKGDYQTLRLTVNDIPPQTPITSSDDDLRFYGHDLKFRQPACRIPSVSDSLNVSKFGSSNYFSGYAEDEGSLYQRNNSSRDLNAQSTMMSKFNVDQMVREHLDTGNYDGASFTDSSDDEIIVIHELDNDVALDNISNSSSRQEEEQIKIEIVPKSKKQFKIPFKSTQVGNNNGHKSKASKLISRINTLKRAPAEQKEQYSDQERIPEKSSPKGGFMSGITKKFNFNQSIKETYRGMTRTKSKPRIEIKTYNEEHSNVNKDEIVCHKKAKTKIDLFQKQILKENTEVDACSVMSSRDSILSTFDKGDIVKETKKIFEPPPQRIETTKPTKPVPKKPNYHKKTRAPNPVGFKPNTGNVVGFKPNTGNVVGFKPNTGNVQDKIKRFSVTIVPENVRPPVTPRKNKEIEIKNNTFVFKLDNKIMYEMKKEFEEVL